MKAILSLALLSSALLFSGTSFAESEQEKEEAAFKCAQDSECVKAVQSHKAKLQASSDRAEAEWAENPIEKAFKVFSIPAIIIGLIYYFFIVAPKPKKKQE